MSRDVNFGVRLQADASAFVGQVNAGEQAVQQFGKTAQKSSNDSAQAYGRLEQSLTKRLNLLNLEREAGRKLTEGERLHLDVISAAASGSLKLSEEQQRSVRAKIDSIKATEAQIAAQVAAQKQAAEASRKEAVDLAQRKQRWAAFGVAVGAAVAAAGVAVAIGFKRAVTAVDDLDEAAKGIGTTAVQLANLRQGAQEAGLAAGRFDTAMDQLNRRIVDAQRGGKESVALFKLLGFNVESAAFQSLTLREALGQIADRFREFGEGPRTSALALELFGRAGAKSIAWLSQGSEGLERFSGLTDETVKQATKLQAQLDRTAASFERIKNAILGVALPVVNGFLETFNDLPPAERIARLATEMERLRKERDAAAQNPLPGLQGRATGQFDRQITFIAEQIRELQRLAAEAEGLGVKKPQAPKLPGIGGGGKPPVDELAEAQKAALEEYSARLREQEQIRAALYQVTATALEQQRRETQQLVDGNQQLREHNEEIGLSAQQVAALRDARMNAAIAQKEEALATAEAIGGQEAAIAVMRREIELLRERQGLMRTGVAREAAAEASRAAVDESKRMAQDVERELTGALMRGFESGKDFAQNLRDTLLNLFQTLVLRPLIAPIVQQGASDLSGLIGRFIGSFATGGGSDFAPGESPTSFTGSATRSAGSTGAIAGDGFARTSAGRGGLQVNVHNYAGADVDVKPSANGLSIDVIVKRASSLIAGDIARGRGDLGRAMEQTYGLQRKPA